MFIIEIYLPYILLFLIKQNSVDCIENMACSDNVVRAGLTPKFIDVDTLCGMLKYKGENPSDKLFNTIKEDQFTKLYKPPVPDFAVAGIEVIINYYGGNLKKKILRT